MLTERHTHHLIRKTILAIFWFALCFTLLMGVIEMFFFALIDFPFNYYESEVVMDAHQYRNGNQVYISATEGPFAGLYAPFFPLFGAFLFLIFPESLLVLRILTLISLLGVAFLYWKASEKQTPVQLLLAVALVLVWHNSLGHFDMHAKPDTFATFWGLLSLFLLFENRHNDFRFVMASAIAVSLSFSTKQNMLFFVPAILAALLLHGSYKAIAIHLATFLVFTALSWWFFYLFTGPAVFFYSFVQPGNFEMRWAGLDSAPYRLLRSHLIGFTLIVVLRVLYRQKWSLTYSLLFLSLVLAFPATIATAIKAGGMNNAFQPFYYLVSFLLIISFQADDWLHKLTSEGKKRWIAPAMVLLLAFSLLMTIRIGPAATFSTWQYRIQAHQEYEALAQELRNTEGIVFAPMDNYLTLKAGKPYVWSAKWEIETVGQRRYMDLARQADHAITINWNAWYRSGHLEQYLTEHGFTEVRRTRMDQQREYVWWKAPRTMP